MHYSRQGGLGPWAQWKHVLEEQNHRCIDMTEKMILLEGPMGRYWYLGERVWRQVQINIDAAMVPIAPPIGMRHANSLEGCELIKSLRGKEASEFIVPNGDYENFRKRYLIPLRVLGVPLVGGRWACDHHFTVGSTSGVLRSGQ